MIKQITKRHLRKIVFYEKTFVDNSHYNKKQLEAMLKSKIYFCIGYFQKDDVMAYLIANVNDVAVDLFKIFVDETLRNRGVGKKLLHYLINHHRTKPIYVEVSYDNVVAIKMYLSLGFKIINERKHYYGNNRHAVIMVI